MEENKPNLDIINITKIFQQNNNILEKLQSLENSNKELKKGNDELKTDNRELRVRIEALENKVEKLSLELKKEKDKNTDLTNILTKCIRVIDQLSPDFFKNNNLFNNNNNKV